MMRFAPKRMDARREAAAMVVPWQVPSNAADAALDQNPKGRGNLAPWRRCASLAGTRPAALRTPSPEAKLPALHMRLFMK